MCMVANTKTHFWAFLSSGSLFNLIISVLVILAIRSQPGPHFAAHFHCMFYKTQIADIWHLLLSTVQNPGESSIVCESWSGFCSVEMVPVQWANVWGSLRVCANTVGSFSSFISQLSIICTYL